MNYETVLQKLHALANPHNVQAMTRYGINPTNNLGISIYQLRKLTQEIGTDHHLAARLWKSKIHDAQLLAIFIDDPTMVTSTQMDTWAADFNSWDICDQTCTSLFDQTPHAWTKVYTWAERNEEYVKRAGFALLAGLAVHDKKTNDAPFEAAAHLIKHHATDERNYVKKAVNWALRNIGKRNQNLNKKMIQLSQEILSINSRSARWIATDALRELKSKKIQTRLEKKREKK